MARVNIIESKQSISTLKKKTVINLYILLNQEVNNHKCCPECVHVTCYHRFYKSSNFVKSKFVKKFGKLKALHFECVNCVLYKFRIVSVPSRYS